MTDKEVLAILRGSPSGTTEARFAQIGVTRAQLDRLVKAGHARISVQVLTHPPIGPVSWFYPK